MTTENKTTLYAVVELFGHARIAGAISEQTFGGAALVRVDVPDVIVTEIDYEQPRGPEGYPQVKRTIAAHTRSFGAGAIYSINWCDEAAAVLAAQRIKHEPLNPYSARDAIASLPADQRTRLLGNTPVDDGLPY